MNGQISDVHDVENKDDLRKFVTEVIAFSSSCREADARQAIQLTQLEKQIEGYAKIEKGHKEKFATDINLIQRSLDVGREVFKNLKSDIDRLEANMKEIKEIKTAVNSLNNKVMLLYAVVIVAPGVLFALYRLLMAVK